MCVLACVSLHVRAVGEVTKRTLKEAPHSSNDNLKLSSAKMIKR